MTGSSVHLLFDLLGYGTAALVYTLLKRHLGTASSPMPAGFGLFYLICASAGAMTGSLLLGTANLMLSGVEGGIGKSVLGALIGGIIAIELMKWRYGIRGSTGGLLVPGIALGIAVGRLGCFAAGLEDFTHGTPSDLPFAVDFGDGIPRHPVQLYEAAMMASFGLLYLWGVLRRPAALLRRGFYLFCAFYAAQRFGWEFIKPYETLSLGLNLFHWGCLLLLAYSVALDRVVQRIPIATEACGHE